eukprot:CAMPEP_0175077002 /NCGR_PEP_ID=MMETSP0052_2-20121109/23102_1 /TAXON_ID=51329 ORGANISM="Polytomella parva, Strain SAG 63-3" /NCGR_SAMPLE_ID=MMETSP0052_2 /ASSEMBLY_ACC=CAM_ASM_000194 /LENGTH=907 /DNA_ID=CAMNT_0016346327 /DNA_START=816 /DNA_END=3539 /DNA_ORIENTATION=-
MDRFKGAELIGKGSYGKVYRATEINTGDVCVVKVVDLDGASSTEIEASIGEARVLSSLRHPHIVPYKDCFRSGSDELLLVMAYCEGGDLNKCVKDYKKTGTSAPESQIWSWLVQLLLALSYTHSKRILHRDVKTQNIFLARGRAMLGDFGLAKRLDRTADMAQTPIGTPFYMAPEIFKEEPYSYKSDMWALGCVIYELVAGHPAFLSENLAKLVLKVIRGDCVPLPSTCSVKLRRTIMAMLQINARNRPSADEVLTHPYVVPHVQQYIETLVRDGPSGGWSTWRMRLPASVISQLSALMLKPSRNISSNSATPMNTGVSNVSAAASKNNMTNHNNNAVPPPRAPVVARPQRHGSVTPPRPTPAAAAAAAPQVVGGDVREVLSTAAPVGAATIIAVRPGNVTHRGSGTEGAVGGAAGGHAGVNVNTPRVISPPHGLPSPTPAAAGRIRLPPIRTAQGVEMVPVMEPGEPGSYAELLLISQQMALIRQSQNAVMAVINAPSGERGKRGERGENGCVCEGGGGREVQDENDFRLEVEKPALEGREGGEGSQLQRGEESVEEGHREFLQLSRSFRRQTNAQCQREGGANAYGGGAESMSGRNQGTNSNARKDMTNIDGPAKGGSSEISQPPTLYNNLPSTLPHASAYSDPVQLDPVFKALDQALAQSFRVAEPYIIEKHHQERYGKEERMPASSSSSSSPAAVLKPSERKAMTSQFSLDPYQHTVDDTEAGDVAWLGRGNISGVGSEAKIMLPVDVAAAAAEVVGVSGGGGNNGAQYNKDGCKDNKINPSPSNSLRSSQMRSFGSDDLGQMDGGLRRGQTTSSSMSHQNNITSASSHSNYNNTTTTTTTTAVAKNGSQSNGSDKGICAYTTNQQKWAVVEEVEKHGSLLFLASGAFDSFIVDDSRSFSGFV